MSRGELVVVGGGIGGLTTALAVARAGRPVRVLERSASFAEVGAGLQLAPNATRILRRLGVLEQVVEAGWLPARLVLSDALDGRELTSLPLGDFPQRYGAPYVVVHRSDLLDILVAACREHGVALEAGRQVVGVDEQPDGVVVRCADGATVDGVAAVGADGLRSTLRELVVADEPVNSGFVAYRGAIPIENATRTAPLSDVAVWFGPGLHFVQYPLRGGEVYNQVAVFRSPRFFAGESEWGTPEELDEAFAVTCQHVRDALPALWRDQHWTMFDREPADTWVRGRTVLTGDAAHPMLQYLAQGACQAVEDAAALADALSAHATDDEAASVGKALLAFQEERVPRASRVQSTARLWGEMWHVDGVARLLRNEAFSQRRPDDHRHVEWLYG